MFTRLPLGDQPDLEEQGRRRQEREVADRPRRARATKASPASSRPRPAAIGYVELAYAKQTELPYASLQEHGGQVRGCRRSRASRPRPRRAATMPGRLARLDRRTPSGDAPIRSPRSRTCSCTRSRPTRSKGKALAEFLWWAVARRPEARARPRLRQLPPEVVTKVEAKLQALTCDRQPLLRPAANAACAAIACTHDRSASAAGRRHRSGERSGPGVSGLRAR